MYHKHQTSGIVLGSMKEGDDSRRISVLTKSFGIVSARLQGARQTRSKLRSGSQDFCLGEFSLVNGRGGWKVVSVDSKKNFFEIFRREPEKLLVVTNVLNLTKKLVSEAGDQGFLFEIIRNFLDFLIEAKDKDVSLSECLVLLRILHSLGYMRDDLEFGISLDSLVMNTADLAVIAPKRLKLIQLINESLKATNLV